MKVFFFLVVLCWCMPAAAQRQKMPSLLARELFSSSVQTNLQKAASQPGYAARVAAQRAAYLQKQQREQFAELDFMLGSYFLPDMEKASAKTLAENRQLQENMIRKWIELDFYASQHAGQLQRGVLYQVRPKINYTQLIPLQARLLLVGEMHKQPVILEEIAQMLQQLKNAYPSRHIYYASEFVASVLEPGETFHILRSEQELAQYALVKPLYYPLARRLFFAGVKVVGLENPAPLSNPTDNRLPFLKSQRAWEMLSPAGVQKRNTYWAQIIRAIYARDPKALVVVHAGNGHVNYDMLNSLSGMLKDLKPLVLNFNIAEREAPAVERYFPLPAPVRRRGAEMRRGNCAQPDFYIRQMTSNRAALVAGYDVGVIIR